MTVELRKYPYPYRAMLAICSDLDETPDAEVYFETARYLNTDEMTSLGKGVALEVGNSLYCEMPAGEFCLAAADDVARRNIGRLIGSGHIDCLHSFGDFVETREQVEYWWQQLKELGPQIEVWIDHATAPSNLDPDIMKGQGAIPGSTCYHADLTLASGAIPFVWKGRVTSLVAQNVARNYGALFTPEHPVASVKTMAIEWLKGILAKLGHTKYAMHGPNRILRNTHLSDNTRVVEFMRCNPSWGGVSRFETAREFYRVVTPAMLAQLEKLEGCSILYTHLGKILNKQTPFPEKTCRAFELLAQWQRDGRVLCVTTRRILGYSRSLDDMSFRVEEGKKTQIYLSTPHGEKDLQGVTFYVDSPGETELYINGERETRLQVNPPDHKGRPSISVPWRRLHFPELEPMI